MHRVVDEQRLLSEVSFANTYAECHRGNIIAFPVCAQFLGPFRVAEQLVAEEPAVIDWKACLCQAQFPRGIGLALDPLGVGGRQLFEPS